MLRVLVVCVCCLGVRAGASEPDWGAWAEAVRKHHPLASSIYALAPPPPSAQQPLWQPPATTLFGNFHMDFVAEGSLFRPLPPDGRGLVLPPGIVLLGEVHDNPAHHQVRGWLIENSAKTLREWRPAIVFEQIRADQQPALDQFRVLAEAGDGSATADDLFRLLEWDKTGWPPAEIYKPLFEAVVAARLPIYAGDPPRDRVRAIARGTPLPAEERARLQLDRPMSQPLLDALHKELEEGHCGAVSEAALSGMSTAQRYRDAHLADALLAAAERHGSAILIAGNGHVRGDRGVPWHVRQRAPTTKVMSVLIAEVEEGKTDPGAYVPRDPQGKAAADIVIFTPKAARSDPCHGLQKSLR